MARVVRRYRCEACDNDEEIVLSGSEARAYATSVTCGGCGRPMLLAGEDREDDGTEDGVPYGPMAFLGL